MTPQEALNILASAAAEYRGTAKEHAMLAEAAQTLNGFINPQPKPKPGADVAAKAAAPFIPKDGPRPVRTRRGRPE